MDEHDRFALLSALKLIGETEVRRHLEAGHSTGKKWTHRLPVIEEWLAAWQWRRKAWLN